MKAFLMSAAKEPLAVRELPDPQPGPGRFVSGCGRLAFAEQTFMCGTESCRSLFRWF